MNILALDTASELLSAALSSGDRIWRIELDGGLRHSELLMECIDELMKLSALKPEDLGLVLAMKGPGSFTGLRIAYAAAKGLSLALGIPFRAFPTLDCMAYALSFWPGLVIPAMDAKKGRFFTGLYRGGEALSPPMDAEPGDLAALIAAAEAQASRTPPPLLTGPGAPLLLASLSGLPLPQTPVLDPNFRRGRAGELIAIAKRSKLQNNEYETEEDLFSGPLYVRKSDAEAGIT
jgi:tRNA threonylcarbamoyladenosine biosynthesis protein TsaB